MSERAEMLATRLDQEMLRMADLVSGLEESQLAAACGDPMGATVAHVLEHLRDGTDQVIGWAATVPGGEAAAGRPAGNGSSPHRHDHDHDHDHDHHHDHAHDHHHAAADATETAAKLRDGAATLGTVVRGLSDEQLDFVPPASPGLTDGTIPLHAFIAFIAEDLAGHRGHLVEALAAERAPQDVR